MPTFGFVIEGPTGAAVIATDTGPTERLWAVAAQCKNLRWVFLDAAFPEARRDLAEISGHMTPTLFAAETAKLESEGLRGAGSAALRGGAREGRLPS